MNDKLDFLTKIEQLLEPLAVFHVPHDSNVKSVIDQWINALATDSQFFCNPIIDNPDRLEKRIIDILKIDNLWLSRIDFFHKVNSNLCLTPQYQHDFKFIDLFAGIGGIRLAAQQNGGVCVFSSEFDNYAQKTYKLNYGDLPFGDITKIDEKSIPEHDLLLAGFPCQPFSYAGKCEGFEDQTRGTLFFDVLRILEEKKPKFALLENVKGFKSHDNGKTMSIALKALEEAGYKPFWTILNSYDFGVPQYRERWYCVAIRKDVESSGFEFPNCASRLATLRDIVDLNDNNPSLMLSPSEVKKIKFHFDHCHLNERVEHDSSMYAPDTKKGRHGVFSYLKKDKSLRFHVGDVAKTQIQEAFYASLDTYAPTIIANRVPKLWDIQRKLSVLEALRLQGFPDKFQFDVSNTQAYKQLGNSVTVPVLSRIINQLMKLEN